MVKLSLEVQASGYAHTLGSQPLRGAPAPGGGSIFVRRHGRDMTFGSSIRVSPAVAALLQRHATSRGQQEADGEGPYSQDAETAEEGNISQQDTQQDLHLNESFHPDLLPAGLTGLMIKGSAATEAGPIQQCYEGSPDESRPYPCVCSQFVRFAH